MLAPSAFMFPDTVVWLPTTEPVGLRGGVSLSPDSGTTLAAYVETTTDNVSRRDGSDVGAPTAVTMYRVFLATDPGVSLDDRFTWGGKTLVARAPAQTQGPCCLIQCQEIR
jgi:hypothetical protein